MIGRRCTHSNVFSRPVLIARNLLSSQTDCRERLKGCVYLSQVIYCGGYSGVEPPLPIPNREVKHTSADGTAPPGGRVGRCRFSEARLKKFNRASFFMIRGKGPPDAPSVGFASELIISYLYISGTAARHRKVPFRFAPLHPSQRLLRPR